MTCDCPQASFMCIIADPHTTVKLEHASPENYVIPLVERVN